MELKQAVEAIVKGGNWKGPEIPGDIPHGDMPGDKVEIGEVHIKKANTIFPELLLKLSEMLEKRKTEKVVLTVCGGSGVGKSEIASLLSYYFNQLGIGSYTLSGDNYPHRIPKYNDAERLHIFRESALKAMVKAGTFDEEKFQVIHQFQKEGDDANTAHVKEYPWYESYLSGGREGLRSYLGTVKEIAFDEIEDILTQFKSGKEEIWLKHMGREDTELWYSKVDFSHINILIIEWTHGNSSNYRGVDIPILLNSTPEETLAHRRARNRDGATDSPFTTMVLELEQAMLEAQASKAAVILSKSGELLSYGQYCRQMEESKGGSHDQ
ncbi:adenylylsulfate kinase [Lacrimispora sp.]|uniref:adenylylsulfate kinase n=1 Tax=Lacrimispora sp. TaxID=2719234 RepID=UPI00345FAC10